MLLLLAACSAEPPSDIVDLLGRLDRDRQLSATDLNWLEGWLAELAVLAGAVLACSVGWLADAICIASFLLN